MADEKQEVIMEEEAVVEVQQGGVDEEEVEVTDEIVEEEVPPPEAPQANVLEQANKALCAWKQVQEKVLPEAKDLHYYAEELYVEDQKFWDHGKFKVRREEWTVDEFDQELKALSKKQEPVWDKLLNQTDILLKKLEQPYKDVQAAAEKVKASIGPHPFGKVLGKPAPTSQEQEIRHEFHWKLDQEFKNAKAEYQEIAGYPEGLLSRVKLFRLNVVREDINITEALHDDKQGKKMNLLKNLPLVGKTGA